MAQQHYQGKKHKKNAARAELLEQLGTTLDMAGRTGRAGRGRAGRGGAGPGGAGRGGRGRADLGALTSCLCLPASRSEAELQL